MIKLMGRLKEIYDEDGDHPYPVGTEGEVLYYSAHDGDCSLFLEDTNLIVAPVDDVEFFFPKETPMPEPATLSEQWSEEVPTEMGWYWSYAPERYRPLQAIYFDGKRWDSGYPVAAKWNAGAVFIPLKSPKLPSIPNPIEVESPASGTVEETASELSPETIRKLREHPFFKEEKSEDKYWQWRVLWHFDGEPATWRKSTLLLQEAGSKEEAIEEFRTNRKPEGIIDVILPIKEKR